MAKGLAVAILSLWVVIPIIIVFTFGSTLAGLIVLGSVLLVIGTTWSVAQLMDN